nr:hypothetical protein [Tanacetum cinerariifolium]
MQTETGRNPSKERGSIRLDPDSGHGCTSVRHGAQVENVSLSRTYDPKEETPKPRPKRALKKKVFEWLKARVIKRFQYLGWVTNVIPIKQRDDNWKMHIDFASLNKVYPKDMYPFLEVKEKLRSLIGHRYKCFPRRVAKKKCRSVLRRKSREEHIRTRPHLRCQGNSLQASKSQHEARSQRVCLWDERRKEVEVQVVEKFFGRGEQELQAPEKDNEASREGSGIGVILIDLEGKEYSHATRLNLHASKDDMDYEALLAGLAASARRQMKDLQVFVNSKLLVDQVEGNREPKKKGAKIYREEVTYATAPFYGFQITYLPKALNPKTEALTGLATIQLEFLN